MRTSTPPSGSRHRIAVIGGGISGLTAAYTLAQARQAGAPIDEFLIEASDRLGGVIQTECVNGFVIESGPDSFLTEKPEAAALCRELGLGDSLLGSNDSDRRTYILHRGKLAPLPDGLMLLVPTRVWPILKTPLLPASAKVKMASEWLRPSRSAPHREDESVANFVRRHFGRALLENIADPLLAGVYGGDTAFLSARSVLPRFWKMEREWGSLTRGVLAARRQRLHAARNHSGNLSAPPPLFTTLRGGLGQLVEALAGRLDVSRVFPGRGVKHIARASDGNDGSFTLQLEGGPARSADAIILALPADQSSRLLAGLDSELAGLLRSIPYNSAMTVSVGYGAEATTQLPPGFGFLAPRHEGRRMLACTFVHNKFSHRAPPAQALLRCFFGGSRDPEVLGMSNGAILALALQELKTIFNFPAQPIFSRVSRWPRSMAQYHVGHEDLISRIQARLRSHPSLALAGNAYSGIGISDCIRSGKAAAERVLSNAGNYRKTLNG